MNEKIEEIKARIEKKKTVDEISEELGLERYQVYGLVQELMQKGYLFDIVDGEIVKLKKPQLTEDVYQVKHDLEHLKLLLLSDTHLGSKHDRLDILRYVYQKAEDLGITTVLHSGDMVDGYYPNRANQVYELKAHGADEQTDYVVNKYPTFDGKTYFITGNHDFTHIRNDGYDIGKAISKQREDLVYLGQDVADLKIGKLKTRLFHGAGSKPYSKSYKLQRYVETIPLEEKPDIQLMGHYHDAFYMKYQGVDCFQVPALIDQTPFARQMGMPNLKGVWWLGIDFNKKGEVSSIKPELETFGKKLVKRNGNQTKNND